MSGSGGSGESATALAASKEERRRNRDLRDSAVSVLESIPQIPIHVTEIKRLIMKARNVIDSWRGIRQLAIVRPILLHASQVVSSVYIFRDEKKEEQAIRSVAFHT